MKLPPKGAAVPICSCPHVHSCCLCLSWHYSPGHNMNRLRMNPPKKEFSRMRFRPSWLHGDGSSANLLGRRQQDKAGNCILFGTNRDLKVVNSSCNHTQGYVDWKDRFGFCSLLVQLLLNTKKCLSSACQTQL